MTTIANPPIWQQNRAYSARLDRTVVDLIFTEGVIDPGGGDFEVIETSPQSLSVAVGVGRAVIEGDDEIRQGKYLIVNDAVLNVPITAAPVAPNDRIDLIVLQVNDPVAGSTRTPANVAEVVAIAGTPSVTPSAPVLPDTAIPLAEVYVAAGATTVTTADITDLRAPASNEIFTVDSNFRRLSAAEIALLTPYEGQTVYNTTANALQYFSNSVWRTINDTTEDVYDYGTVTTNTNIDLNLAPVQTVEIGGNVTLTITNAPSIAGVVRSVLLLVQQDAVGSRVITWSGVDRWFNEVNPSAWAADEERAITVIGSSTEVRAFVVPETI